MKIIESSDKRNIGLEVAYVPQVTKSIALPNGYVMAIEQEIQLTERIYKLSNKNYTIILEESI